MPRPTLLLLFIAALPLGAQTPHRARDLHVPFDGDPGPLNAITDVPGVAVGHTTLISGEGKLQRGVGPVRTGVTAILPRGIFNVTPVFAGYFAQNGNGEMTGTAWLEESGFAESPILITNTHSVGLVRDAVIKWQLTQADKANRTMPLWSLPIVAETWDGFLNDINGFHVEERHVFAALNGAQSGPVPEGAVGGGTGMVCYGFKGGIGTSSRKLAGTAGGYTVGVLVQCNCGRRPQLTIAGVPVGKEIPGQDPYAWNVSTSGQELGSIIIIVATDAPLLPTQLKRLAHRATMGLARTGSISGNGSGDLFLAFSTANEGAAVQEEAAGQDRKTVREARMLVNDAMDPLFAATVQATEEAIVNAMVASDTMTGVDGHTVMGLPRNDLVKVLQKYNRLAP
jgi:L-aminopeptidase/D-esterase-like protein